MQGDSLAARAKVFRTRAAPRPTNISTKSDPEQYKRGTPAVAAVARASIVLPNVDCDGWCLCVSMNITYLNGSSLLIKQRRKRIKESEAN